jgi:enamine deaminase RidA (YjgF/YER057c/UK114 family)
MPRRLISLGSAFEKRGSYSRAVVDGDFCFVAGTTGYDYAAMTIPDTVAEQARNIFRTIENVLKEAGFSLADIVRVTHYVTDINCRDELYPVVAEYLGDVRPASTLVGISALATPQMKVEIEVTAKRRAQP